MYVAYCLRQGPKSQRAQCSPGTAVEREASPEIPLDTSAVHSIVGTYQQQNSVEMNQTLQLPKDVDAIVRSKTPPPLLPCRKRTLEKTLSNLNPKLVHIVGKIRGVGIHEESDLVETLQWPEAVREHFFQVTAGLNPFLYTMLKIGFEKALK